MALREDLNTKAVSHYVSLSLHNLQCILYSNKYSFILFRGFLNLFCCQSMHYRKLINKINSRKVSLLCCSHERLVMARRRRIGSRSRRRAWAAVSILTSCGGHFSNGIEDLLESFFSLRMTVLVGMKKLSNASVVLFDIVNWLALHAICKDTFRGK